MKFLDTDPETFYTLLNPIIPSPITTGLLCLAGGIGYYSWNYYKNNKQEVKAKPIQKNNLEKEINSIKKEEFTIIKNYIKLVQENAIKAVQEEEFEIIENAMKPIQKNDLEKKVNSIEKEEFTIIKNDIEPTEKQEFDMLNDANETTDKYEFDMLDDAENEFKTVVNDDSDWAMIEMPSNSSNFL